MKNYEARQVLNRQTKPVSTTFKGCIVEYTPRLIGSEFVVTKEDKCVGRYLLSDAPDKLLDLIAKHILKQKLI